MKKLLMLLLFPAMHATAQDLTGVWRGTFFSNRLESLFGSDNKFEIQIDNNARACRGVTYSYQNTTFYAKASLVGMWSPTTKNLIFQEEKILEYKMTGDKSDIFMFTCYLEYRKEGDKEILEGDYSSTKYKTDIDGGKGKIYLERVATSDFKKEDFVLKKEKSKEAEKLDTKKPMALKTNPSVKKKLPGTPPQKNNPSIVKSNKPQPKKQVTATPPQKPNPSIVKITPPSTKSTLDNKSKKEVVVIPPVEPKEKIVIEEPIKKPETVKAADLPRVLKERSNELVQTILTPGPDIVIELYDNGEIDGDTITVFQNGKQIAYRRGLSTQAITLKVKIDEDNPEQEIVMVAENLGSIPPNTALMIVKTGGNRYDLRISSNEQKNAVVKFKYKKE